MKLKTLNSIAIILLLAGISTVSAQTSAQERADTLRLQLEEVKTKQLDLETRLQVLDEQSKPENIEKSLAGVGSTHPEDLRELKRKQFENEKASVQKQLALLADSRTRLEAGVAQADAAAYQQSAKGPAMPVEAATTTGDSVAPAPKQRQRRARARRVKTKKTDDE